MCDGLAEPLSDELRRTRDNVPDLGHIPDLFKAGSYLKEEDAQSFFGREDEWHQLENFMLAPAAASAILLRGARRMGKSSLLLQLPRLLGPDCTACYLDMQNAACNENLPRFFTALSEAITTALLRRGVTVQGLLIAQLRDEPFATFNEWLDSTEKAMRPGLRICICIDEYERMSVLPSKTRTGVCWTISVISSNSTAASSSSIAGCGPSMHSDLSGPVASSGHVRLNSVVWIGSRPSGC